MTTTSTTEPSDHIGHTDLGQQSLAQRPSTTSRWEGRVFGALVLAAFVLYGVGSASADEPAGLVLVALNSIAVTIVGLIGFRLLWTHHPQIGIGYLATRILEAVLLAGGIAIVWLTDSTDADTTGYLLAMAALGVGSIPFFHVLGQGRWLPQWLARWGVVGYAALTAGALLELTTGRGLTVFFAVPGGLFELTLGLYLLRRGFIKFALARPPKHEYSVPG